MEKKKSRSYRFAFIVFSILFICSISLNILVFIKTNELKEKLVEVNDDYNNIELSVNKKKEELDNILKEKDSIIDIDNSINNTREEFFSKVKILEDKILAGESDKKIAYLTFDDGPYYASYKYLEILEQYDVLATFFTIGAGKTKCYEKTSVSCYPVYNEEAKRGHTMANHTFSHAIFKGLYASPESFIEQVKKQENLLIEQAGVKPNIVRFPGGSATAGSKKNAIIELLRQNGYGWVDWTAATGDGGALKNASQAWNNFVNSLDSNIEVILMHDYSTITLSILPKEIEYLKEQGYSIFPLFYESNMVNK